MTHLRRFAWIAASCSIVTVTACSSSTNKIPSPPVAGTYTIDFPSVASAIATNTIQAYVYAADDASDQCFSLVETSKTGGALPAAQTQTQPTPVCADVDGGSGSLSLPFGSYAVLVVGQRGGTNFLIGCAEQTLSESQPVVNVTLTLATAEAPPATTCTSLAQSCGGTCADGGS